MNNHKSFWKEQPQDITSCESVDGVWATVYNPHSDLHYLFKENTFVAMSRDLATLKAMAEESS